ncbi:MAG: T9SS C-terminal target domain-containing protein [Flavobacteriales bacterium]|nr:T9SS C-terminal target domain-containing protein [Flavobacteriales bacterium]
MDARSKPLSLALLLLTGTLAPPADAQVIADRSLVLEEVTLAGMPGLQSFAWGTHNGEWLLLGGRTDGLHRRQPPVAFLAADNNTTAWVVAPATGQVWSAPLSTLPTGLFEQLQCTNMESAQRDSMLYIVGGYAYSATAGDHITHDRLTAVHVPNAIAAIKAGTSLAPHFRQLADARMAVTGGYLGRHNDLFLLVGGQRFIGRYNPIGPDHGPGFVQQYTNAIRRFRISDDGVNLSITDFSETVDTVNLHRRDYNLVPQVFPDGTHGFTAFSGVFQYVDDVPWLNTVDITDSAYTVVPGFEQWLNQYHTAHLPMHDATDNSMRTLFFGGIGRYHYVNGVLVDDPTVPFVNTISLVTRASDGTMVEEAVGTMPGLLGASAELIPSPGLPMTDHEVLQLDQLPPDSVLVGHIVGGIESTAESIFFINTGTQSDASTRLFRVWLLPSASAVGDVSGTDDQALTLRRMEADRLIAVLQLPAGARTVVDLLNSAGRRVRGIAEAQLPKGRHELVVDLRGLAPGAYTVEARTPDRRWSARFVR